MEYETPFLSFLLAHNSHFAPRLIRLRNLERGRFNLPDGLQESLHDLLQRMMDPVPENRPTIGEVMQHPWYCNVSILPARLRTVSHGKCPAGF